MTYASFETERLFIRPTQVEDAAFILELLNSPKWIKFIGDRNVRTLEQARLYIEEKMLPQLERLGFSNNIVIRKSDGAKIGACGLYDREGLEGLDIGFAFLPQFEGKGYGFESAQRIKQAGLEDFGVQQISAITTKENVASQKLLEKIGLQFCEYMRLPNDPEELLLYKLFVEK